MVVNQNQKEPGQKVGANKMTATEYISNHPVIALVVGVTHIITAEFMNSMELPTILMQIFQLGAWSVTITVGIITIYGFFKNKKK